jgi:uncharacterized protein (TIGR02246 family)
VAVDDPHKIATEVLHQLDSAWNAADGTAFAAAFTEDADVVNVFGTHIKGRAPVAERIQLMFDTAFKGSHHEAREMEKAYFIAPGLVLSISLAKIAVPSGPLAPRASSRQTSLIVNDAGTWRVRHWHNTAVQDAR